MIESLLPRTGTGVVFQVAVATIGFAAVTWLVRHRPKWRMLTIARRED
ncbi:MAG: hypothetical protein GY720_11925 [bacterium]|nr:hypothetical protein [bacterium]